MLGFKGNDAAYWRDLTEAIIRDPLIVAPDVTVAEAIALMNEGRTCCDAAASGARPSIPQAALCKLKIEARSSCVLVVEGEPETSKVVGILTERDIVRLCAQQRSLDGVAVSEVMTRSVKTLKESALTDLFSTINLLQQNHIRHLPLVDDQGNLVGLLTHETLQHLLQPSDLLRLRVVEEVMQCNVITAAPTVSLLFVAELMSRHRISSVVIATPLPETEPTPNAPQRMRPVGIITERDLVQFQSLALDFSQYTVRQVMSTPVITVGLREPLVVVKKLIEQYLVHRVVVTGDAGELLGIITQSTVLQAFNPLELYELTKILEAKVSALETEKIQLLENNNLKLEQEVAHRTLDLQKQLQREQIVANLAIQVRSSLKLQTILETAVVEIRQAIDCERVNIWRFDAEWATEVIAESRKSATSLLGMRVVDQCFRPDFEKTYHPGYTQVVRDIYATEMTDCHRDLLVSLQSRAKILTPLFCGDKLWGLLNVCESDRSRDWQTDEIELLGSMATQISIAILQASTHEKLQAELEERQQTETQLRQSKDRLKEAQRLAKLGHWELDFRTQSLYWSEEIFRIFEITPREFGASYEAFLSFVHPDDRSFVDETYKRHLGSRIPYVLVHRLQLADGQIKYVREQCETIYNEAGFPLVSRGTVQDITVQHEAELQLAQTAQSLEQLTVELEARVAQRTADLADRELQLQGFLEGAHDLIQSVNIKTGHFEFVNPAWCEALGYSEAEVKDLTFFDLLAPDCRPTSGQHRRDWFFEHLGEVELTLIAKSGQAIVVEGNINCRIGLDEAGQQSPLSTWAILRDVTERRRFEAERQRLLQELAGFKSGLDEAAIVAITDANGVITYVNQRFVEISGYSKAELLGQTHRLVNSGTHPPQFFQELWNTIIEGETWRGEICNRTKTGGLYWVDSTIVPFFDATGKPDRYLAVRFDITEQKRSQLLLQENLYLLRGVTQAQSQFITAQNRLEIFEGLLEMLLEITNSEYGFIGEVKFQDDGSAAMEEGFLKVRGIPYLKTHSITNIAWNAATQKFYEDNYEQGMEFTNMNTLFGTVIMTGQPVIANSPKTDPRRGGTPEGHPPLNAFLGLPFFGSENLLGMVGVANRPGGYDQDVVDVLRPLLVTCSNLIEGYRQDRLRRIAEEALQESQQSLQRQLAAIEAAVNGIAILQNGRYLYLNSAHVQLFGYESAEELLGQTWQMLYDPEELDRFDREVFPVLQEQLSWQGEATATRKDGTTFAEQLSLTLSGEDDLVICVCQDISDRKAAEEELRRTNIELERATRLKDEFLANMSHELRTPLNSILGMTEALQEEVFGIVNEKQLKALQTTERSATHLLTLINDILDVAKIESGQVTLEFSRVSVEQLCSSSLAFVKQLALKKNIRLDTEIPASLPPLFVDEVRIRQVLLNLLTNAVKFTLEGGTVTLSVSFLPSKTQASGDTTHFLRIAITDSGIGISPENIAKLFKPFVQIDSALNRQQMGTGLGLALVKRLVELHGGQVGLTSTEGVGSCFTVDLPYDAASYATPAAPQSPSDDGKDSGEQTALQGTGQSTLVLLVEDNPDNIATLSAYLEAKNYELVLANDGYEAIEKAAQHQPNIILMDIQMPGMDGLEAIEHIRKQESTRNIPIIALTALAMKGDRERCLEVGANEYLSKPVKLKQLDNAIKALVFSR